VAPEAPIIQALFAGDAMQFRLNGFKPGDPQISEPAEPFASQPSDALPQSTS
jgi:hypothetical protein